MSNSSSHLQNFRLIENLNVRLKFPAEEVLMKREGTEKVPFLK